MARKLTNMLAYLDERLGTHSGRGPEYQFFCPACVDRMGDQGSKRKLGVNVAKGKGGCFRCGFGFVSFTRLFLYINGGRIRMEELALLRHEVAIPETKKLKSAVRETLFPKDAMVKLKTHALPHEAVRLADLTEAECGRAQYLRAFSYLAERETSAERVREFDIHYCPSGDYAQRLVFPVRQAGKVVYFTSRYCGDHPMKSRNPPNTEGFHQRGTCLLNYDNCIGVAQVALTEGPFSCMAFPHSLALMGKFLTDDQRRLILALVPHGLEEIVIALDPGAGEQSDDVYRSLLGHVPRVSVLPLEGGDPHDLRESLPALLRGRRVPTVADRVRQRLNG